MHIAVKCGHHPRLCKSLLIVEQLQNKRKHFSKQLFKNIKKWYEVFVERNNWVIYSFVKFERFAEIYLC